MIWKFWFYFSVILYVFIGVASFTQGDFFKNSTELSYLSETIFFLVYILMCAYFGALGWGKKVYSLKFTNICVWAIPLLTLIFIVISSVSSYEIILKTPDLSKTQIMGATTFACIYNIVLNAILISPAYIAILKYKKRYNEFKTFNNTLYKLISFGVISGFISAFIFMFIVNFQNSVLKYNYFDLITFLLCIYTSFFLIGLSFDKPFLNQLFWKISAPLYAVLFFISLTLSSAQFKQDALFYTLNHLWVYKIFVFILLVIIFYLLIIYSYTKKVFKESD